MLSLERIERIRKNAAVRQARYRRRHPERVREYRTRNAEKIRQANILWYQKNLDVRRQKNKAGTDARRARILEFFGNQCMKCGFSDRRALQVDHINGGGHQERKGKEISGLILRAITQSADQARLRYQLLCANCNVIKRIECGEHGTRRKY